MTQPWDYWHVVGAGGLTVQNVRDRKESAGVLGNAVATLPNILTATPFWVGDDGVSVNKIGIVTSSSGNGTCRIGIYKCPPPSAHDMYPSSLVQDFGEMTMTGSVNPRYLSISPSCRLNVGLYYVAMVFSSARSTIQGDTLVGGPGYLLGYSRISGRGLIGFAVRHNYGPLPTSFPALPSNAFGVWHSGGAAGFEQAIYWETKSALGGGDGGVTVTIQQAAITAGTAVVTSDTATNVTVNYGPSTSPSVVAAALASATGNISLAESIGGSSNLPNLAIVIPSQPAGPLQTQGNARTVEFSPVKFIEVDV